MEKFNQTLRANKYLTRMRFKPQKYRALSGEGLLKSYQDEASTGLQLTAGNPDLEINGRAGGAGGGGLSGWNEISWEPRPGGP